MHGRSVPALLGGEALVFFHSASDHPIYIPLLMPVFDLQSAIIQRLASFH